MLSLRRRLIALRESAVLAERLITACSAREHVARGPLTIHADRGWSRTSKPSALLFADLGVTQSHARPPVSTDNRYSEAQCRTLMYRPDFPERFGSIYHARAATYRVVDQSSATPRLRGPCAVNSVHPESQTR